MSFKRSNRKQIVTTLVCLQLILCFHFVNLKPLRQNLERQTWAGTNLQNYIHVTDPRKTYSSTPCKDLPGANDTLLILRTGSTEFMDKLPIHLRTTLQCLDHMIFSDLAETYNGHAILDALSDVSPEIRNHHPDFDLYRDLRSQGRAFLRPEDLSGSLSRPHGGSGKPENPGWKLDKWKFLSMARQTLERHPEKSWYVFVEPDNFTLRSSLLAYLRALNATEPYYVGAEVYIGEVLFAQGGAGFAVSHPALQKVVAHYLAHKNELEEFTHRHWAGDCVLGKTFADAGVQMTQAWPIWQEDDVGSLDYAREVGSKRMWCRPSVSYHHLTASVIEDLWSFEQDWLAEQEEPEPFLRHSDVYAHYILPRTRAPRADWDNHANEDRGVVASLDNCRLLCEQISSCVQYRLDATGKCLTTSRPNLGESASGVQSGWVHERMCAFAERFRACEGQDWIL